VDQDGVYVLSRQKQLFAALCVKGAISETVPKLEK